MQQKNENYINLYLFMILNLQKAIKLVTDLKSHKMKIIKLFLTVFSITVFNINCVPHCDNKDYTRDQKEAEITKANSVLVIKQ